MTKEITTKPDDQTFSLLQQAVQAGTSPEALEKLVALQERILDRNAEAEFTVAMAEFQARCPSIEKRHAVRKTGGQIMYHYAPLEDIVTQIRPLMAELGLSFSFDSEVDEKGGCEVTCTVRHRAGHAEHSRVKVPSTQGHNTNAAQNMGLQLTYGKRLSLIGALGITTADADQDGQTQQVAPITTAQATMISNLCEEVGADKRKFLEYIGAPSFADIQARDYDRALAALQAKRAKQ